MSLISDAELAAIQSVAESGMNTPVYISHRTNVQTEDGQSSTWVEDANPVLGWLYEFTPSGATIGVISGQMGLAEGVWLRLPVGTNINSGDRARVGSLSYTVEHTNAESTYRPWIACSVRIIV